MMQPGKDKDKQETAQPLSDEKVAEDLDTVAGQDPAEVEIASTGEEGVVAEDEVEPELSPEEVLRAERDRFEEKWLRAVAEMDNVRKRSRREMVDSRRFAQADMLRAFLGVLDNIERAFATESVAEDGSTPDGFRAGVELVFQQYQDVLKDFGVRPIEAMAAEFDPVNHEAVGQLEREGAEAGQIIEIVQQGYMFGDMVLRPARVIIAS